MAERELANHGKQIKDAEEIEHFLAGERVGDHAGKTTDEDFFTWLKRETRGLHSRCFDLAFEVARKAERALQHELGDPQLRYVQDSYMAGDDSLLAGERLYLDIRRMEVAYHDLNRREYELTKQVSLLQVDPKALMELRTNGKCTFSLPEELYDLDGSGHYFRRIKSVALTVAGVTGPYTGVNATLTLLRSSIRRTPRLVGASGVYERGPDDDRFSDSFGSLDSIVTSTGVNDAGLFETNLRDERLLPFEGHGAVSTWQLTLPDDVRQFDYDTIADVVLHVRYTAREGGDQLAAAAVANLKRCFVDATAVGSVRLFSVPREFPTEWAKFKATPPAADGTATLALELRKEHYPFWSAGRLELVKALDLYARTTNATLAVSSDQAAQPDPFIDTPLRGLRGCHFEHIPLPAPVGTFEVKLNDNSIDELWLVVTWAEKAPAH